MARTWTGEGRRRIVYREWKGQWISVEKKTIETLWMWWIRRVGEKAPLLGCARPMCGSTAPWPPQAPRNFSTHPHRSTPLLIRVRVHGNRTSATRTERQYVHNRRSGDEKRTKKKLYNKKKNEKSEIHEREWARERDNESHQKKWKSVTVLCQNNSTCNATRWQWEETMKEKWFFLLLFNFKSRT